MYPSPPRGNTFQSNRRRAPTGDGNRSLARAHAGSRESRGILEVRREQRRGAVVAPIFLGSSAPVAPDPWHASDGSKDVVTNVAPGPPGPLGNLLELRGDRL